MTQVRRLELAFDRDWSREDIAIEVFPLVARGAADVDAVLLHGAPAGAIVQRSPSEQRQTVTGWPLSLHHAVLRDGEIRLVAHYQILVLAGFVLVRIASEPRYVEHRARLIELLASAQPRLADDTPAAISELWEMP